MLIQTDPSLPTSYTPEHYYARIEKCCPGLSADAVSAAVEVLRGKVNAWCATNPRISVDLPQFMGGNINDFQRPDEFKDSELSMLCGVEYVDHTGDMAHERLAAELILTYVVSADNQHNFERDYVGGSNYLCYYSLLAGDAA